MAQVTVNLPSIANWRTTLLGIITSIGAALFQYVKMGAITWQGAVACIVWAVFCYLVPDAASNKATQAQLEALLSALSASPVVPAPGVQARTDAPAVSVTGQPFPPVA